MLACRWLELDKAEDSLKHGTDQRTGFVLELCKTLQPPIFHKVTKYPGCAIVTELGIRFKRITTKWKFFSLLALTERKMLSILIREASLYPMSASHGERLRRGHLAKSE